MRGGNKRFADQPRLLRSSLRAQSTDHLFIYKVSMCAVRTFLHVLGMNGSCMPPGPALYVCNACIIHAPMHGGGMRQIHACSYRIHVGCMGPCTCSTYMPHIHAQVWHCYVYILSSRPCHVLCVSCTRPSTEGAFDSTSYDQDFDAWEVALLHGPYR